MAMDIRVCEPIGGEEEWMTVIDFHESGFIFVDREYIVRNAGLEETQAGINIAGRNISNLRYADDTTLMAESEEELKSLLMKVKKLA
ncbi:hypothetical protein MJG53_019605 [Ovis ammon polii x Ovis aries]|uniref:Uncharacterized protein n=1 Tax=Ovis ammon polii x Ovis aries TaxID=2918886 RepID=A0ACB9U0C0_9CETA|nr:hypothetical protein MJG53_019605 [Ovis ammon polii x Ovis aries]